MKRNKKEYTWNPWPAILLWMLTWSLIGAYWLGRLVRMVWDG